MPFNGCTGHLTNCWEPSSRIGALRILNALAGYLADDSERLTCAQMVSIFGYYFKGGHYPIGGSEDLADVLVGAIKDRGGAVHLKTPVRRFSWKTGAPSVWNWATVGPCPPKRSSPMPILSEPLPNSSTGRRNRPIFAVGSLQPNPLPRPSAEAAEALVPGLLRHKLAGSLRRGPMTDES